MMDGGFEEDIPFSVGEEAFGAGASISSRRLETTLRFTALSLRFTVAIDSIIFTVRYRLQVSLNLQALRLFRYWSIEH